MSADSRKTIETFVEDQARADSVPQSVWLFPGLGSRFVGMGADLIGRYEAADERIATAERLLGYDISEVCLSGSGRKVVPQTVEAQVIYVINCAYADVLSGCGQTPVVVCGHSLGTWAAAYAAGAFSFETGLQLVTSVEDLLEELIPGGEQAMGVVIGLDEEIVESLCRNEFHVYLANRNSPGQSVLAGSAEGVDSVLAQALQMSAKKAKRLAGSRAMHTPLLRDVEEELRKVLSTTDISDTLTPVWDCYNARPLHSVDDLRQYLSEFLSRPVEWSESILALRDRGHTNFVEVGAAAVLTGMLPFIDHSLACETTSDWLMRHEPSTSTHSTHSAGPISRS